MFSSAATCFSVLPSETQGSVSTTGPGPCFGGTGISPYGLMLCCDTCPQSRRTGPGLL